MRVKGLCASLGSGGEPRVMPIVLHVHIYYLLVISIHFGIRVREGALCEVRGEHGKILMQY